MAKLNQIIAIANGKKSKSQADLTELYHALQKPASLDGITRTYRSCNEEGEQLPSESKKVQVRVSEVIEKAKTIFADVVDVVATQDNANTVAFADVVVGGQVVIAHVPVTNLLFLEKHLIDLSTFVEKLPTLDPAESWEKNQAMDCYATKPYETTRTKKIPRNHVKYDATKEHPAQVEMYMEDVLVGYWQTIKFSGAIQDADRRAMLGRIRKLQEAVKMAREEANSTEVKDISIAKGILGYVFGT